MTATDTPTPSPATAGSTQVEAKPVVSCTVCNHPMSAHDRTAGRYCDATQSNALSRRCICHL